jgi:5'-phosphate synthase pdxT subunit
VKPLLFFLASITETMRNQALQGAFAEHQVALQKVSVGKKVVVVQVRTTADLDQCDALVIPGGGTSDSLFREVLVIIVRVPESTTIALLARLSGLLDPLREFLERKPVWGTCAGAILLARSVEGAKKGGQELLGGMSITILRNGWGSQVGLNGTMLLLRELVRNTPRWCR